MAKQGMNRPEWTHNQQKNTAATVPEIQGKAKHGNSHVNPIIAGTKSPAQKVYHTKSFSQEKRFPMRMLLLITTLQETILKMTLPLPIYRIYKS